MIKMGSWIELLKKSIQNNKKFESSYFQLATNSLNGYPSNRTIVFRGFLKEGEIDDQEKSLSEFMSKNPLKFTTDVRSEKVKELHLDNRAQLCWYFHDTKEQFRISGKIWLIGDNISNSICPKIKTTVEETFEYFQPERKNTWNSLSPQIQSSFSFKPPGEPFNESIPQINPENDQTNYCLGIIEPIFVDYVCLQEPHTRYKYQWENNSNWSSMRVNP